MSQRSVPLYTAVNHAMSGRGTILTNQAFRKQLVQYCFRNGFAFEGSGSADFEMMKRKRRGSSQAKIAQVSGDGGLAAEGAPTRARKRDGKMALANVRSKLYKDIIKCQRCGAMVRRDAKQKHMATKKCRRAEGVE